MRRLPDQELSPAAAHRILRSIAYWDWTKLDQASGPAEGLPVLVGPLREDVFEDIEFEDIEFEDIQDDYEPTPSPTFLWWKRAGAWYLNEVPEELLAECEKELWTPDQVVNLREAPEARCAVGAGERDGGAAVEDPCSALPA
jgi:hypothetical protein